jgi:hypothetical protein
LILHFLPVWSERFNCDRTWNIVILCQFLSFRFIGVCVDMPVQFRMSNNSLPELKTNKRQKKSVCQNSLESHKNRLSNRV